MLFPRVDGPASFGPRASVGADRSEARGPVVCRTPVSPGCPAAPVRCDAWFVFSSRIPHEWRHPSAKPRPAAPLRLSPHECGFSLPPAQDTHKIVSTTNVQDLYPASVSFSLQTEVIPKVP